MQLVYLTPVKFNGEFSAVIREVSVLLLAVFVLVLKEFRARYASYTTVMKFPSWMLIILRDQQTRAL